MESRITDKRKETMVVDIDMLVPKEHLLRRIDKVMDYEWLYAVFADAKEKHALRYTTYQGLARVTNWMRLKHTAVNLKKLVIWMNMGAFSVLLLTIFTASCGPFSFSLLFDCLILICFFDKLSQAARFCTGRPAGCIDLPHPVINVHLPALE